MADAEIRELRWRIKQLGKQNGRQGDTIHRLRTELAEMRELTPRIERNELRQLDATVASLREKLAWNAETIAALREKLNGESADD